MEVTNIKSLKDNTIGNEKIRVLIVEDEAHNADLLELILISEGYMTYKASSGEEALEMIDDLFPYVVLLDVLMPGINGYQVCERIKNNVATRFIPVIMITALNSLNDRVRGIEAGADYFISKPFHKEELLARIKSLVRIRSLVKDLESAQNVLFSLASAIDCNDPYTHGHSQRVSDLSGKLARFIGLSETEEKQIKDAGILHDIGKIATDKGILHKPDVLNNEEYNHIKAHPVAGERICAPLLFARPLLPIIRNHHERFDGSGYPDGLWGGKIAVGARVISIVDVFDALTTMRPYRRGIPKHVALEMIADEVARERWDSEIFGAFDSMIKSASFSC